VAWIGYGQNGMVTLNGGLMDSTGAQVFGRNNVGRIIVNSGTLGNTASGAYNGLTIGMDNGRGYLDIDGGLVSVTSLNLVKGVNNATTQAHVTLTGGTLSANTINFGAGNGARSDSGTASLTMSDGVLLVGSGGIADASITGTASGTNTFQYDITLSGGTVGALNSNWSSSVDMILQTGSNGNVAFDAVDTSFNGRTITLSGRLTGSGGLNVSGGTLLLQGINSYQGQSLISSGATLEIGGSQTISLASLGNSTAAFAGSGSLTFNEFGSISTDIFEATGTSWILFDNTLLSNVTYSANWLTGFTDQGNGIWTWNDYTYNQSTGILLLIPEPSAFLLVVIGILVMTVCAKRYRKT
jgi:hypothetical protein